MNPEMTLYELKDTIIKFDEVNDRNIKNIRKLNDILLSRLERSENGYNYPSVTEKTKKLQSLIGKLSDLIDEKSELTLSIESKHEALKNLYIEQKGQLEMLSRSVKGTSEQMNFLDRNRNNIASEESQHAQTQMERDKALGLVKILLATLKSSRIQCEENFHKQKHSADVMFHLLYKVEDKFFSGNES